MQAQQPPASLSSGSGIEGTYSAGRPVPQPKTSTIVVNMLGGPGAGKSTMASHVFALLKWAGIRSELALEYAKTKVWEGSESVLEDQIYLFGKQRHAQFILEDKVSVIVTDSPILLSIVYDQTKNPHLRELVLQQFHRNHNVTVALTRKKKYDKIGRQQTLEQAVEKDVQLRDLLAQEGIPYHELEGVPETAQAIVELVKQKLAELASENDVD